MAGTKVQGQEEASYSTRNRGSQCDWAAFSEIGEWVKKLGERTRSHCLEGFHNSSSVGWGSDSKTNNYLSKIQCLVTKAIEMVLEAKDLEFVLKLDPAQLPLSHSFPFHPLQHLSLSKLNWIMSLSGLKLFQYFQLCWNKIQAL